MLDDKDLKEIERLIQANKPDPDNTWTFIFCVLTAAIHWVYERINFPRSGP
jgi:hypothetical protein